MMHRESTRSTWEGRIKNHLEPDWKDVPLDLITFDAVSEWAAKKRTGGLSWASVKDSLRTMQRVISAFRKDRKVPFSQRGLMPDTEKLRMKVQSRKKVSYSWNDAEKIAEHVRKMDGLGDSRREQYSTLILLAAGSGLRCSELLALRVSDLDFDANTVIVDEASDQRHVRQSRGVQERRSLPDGASRGCRRQEGNQVSKAVPRERYGLRCPCLPV